MSTTLDSEPVKYNVYRVRDVKETPNRAYAELPYAILLEGGEAIYLGPGSEEFVLRLRKGDSLEVTLFEGKISCKSSREGATFAYTESCSEF